MLTAAGVALLVLVAVYAASKLAVTREDYKRERAAREFDAETDVALGIHVADEGADRWGTLDELQLRRARRNGK